jgi:glycosyltransferase involved in cell wall biosynthesis
MAVMVENKRVLFVTFVDLSENTGQGVATSEILRALIQDKSVRSHIICPWCKTSALLLENNGCKVTYLPRKRGVFWHLYVQICLVWAFMKVIRTESIDTVVARLSPSLVLLPMLVGLYKKEYILLARGDFSRWGYKLFSIINIGFLSKISVRLNLKRADRIYTAFERISENVDMYRKPSQAKAEVLSNAVDPTKFPLMSIQDARNKLKILDKGERIGFIGSFKQRHCIAPLFEAVSQIKDESDLRIMLVGGGPCLNELRLCARKLGVEDRIDFMGAVPHSEVHTYISACDFLYGVTHPDKPSNPIKCYEYMACGRTVIASNQPEFRFVTDKNFGAVVDNKGVQTGLEILLKLSGEKRKQMGLEARNYIIDHHTWSGFIKTVLRQNEHQ